MIYYLGRGPRNYERDPVPVHTRGKWEFQIFHRRPARLVLSGETSSPETEDNFFIFRPDCAHGWRGARGGEESQCTISSFHLHPVPETLRILMQETPYRSVRLGADGLDAVAEIAALVSEELKRPGPLTSLRFEKYGSELSLLFLEAFGGPLPDANQETRIVEIAISWYENNLDRGVGVKEAAAEMGYSESHLRRLFTAALNESPREVFLRIRMEKARSLLRNNRLPILDIALACGYPNHSSFSRAFKRYFGIPPVELERSPRTQGTKACVRPDFGLLWPKMKRASASPLFLLVSLILFSCAPEEPEKETTPPRKITAFLDTIIQDWEGQDRFVEEYLRKTGIELEIIQPPHQQYMDSLFLHISSDRVPDVCEILPEYLPHLVNSRIAIPLDAFIEESENIDSVDPRVLASVRYSDGRTYGFPARDGGGCVTYVRRDWLEAAGLEAPVDWDGFVQMLEAFTYGDPDGNGADDTYGLTDMFSASQDWYNRPVFQDARAEIYFDGSRWRDGFAELSIRGALARLIELYDRGLIDPSFITNTTYSARTKFFNGEVGAITYWANHWSRNLYERTRATVGKSAEVVPIPAIEGVRYIRRISPLLVVTSGADDPGFVFSHFIDRQYDTGEIQTLFTYGVEGYHWSKQSGVPRFLPNPEDPYEAPFTKAFVPPAAVINDWDQPMPLDPLVLPALEHLNRNPVYDRLRTGGEAYDRYFDEIERSLKPDIITAVVTGQISIDEGLARYRRESRELKIDRILDELNGLD